MAYIKKEPIIQFIKKGLNNPNKQEAFGYDAIEILAEIEYAPTAEVEEKRNCEKCVHFLKDVIQYPCSHCRNCYTDKFQPNDIHQEEGEDK